MKAIIFAAGLGTRLKPLTDTMPKALVPINGKPLLEWQLEKLYRAGLTDIIVNVHHFPDQIIDYLHTHYPSVQVSDERNLLLETGGGLMKVLQDNPTLITQNEPVLALNVDILSNIDLPAFIRAYRPDDIASLVVSNRTTQRYLCWDKNLQLKGWTNIATGELRPTPDAFNLADTQLLAFSGMQLLSPRVLPYMQEIGKDKFSVIDLYLHIVAQHPSERVRAYVPCNYRMMDIGKIDHLTEAEHFAKNLSEAN